MSAARTEVFTIEKTLPSERLDTFLRGKFPAVSRGAIQRLIDEGHVHVNGRKVKPTHTPRAGEKVEVHWPSGNTDIYKDTNADNFYLLVEGETTAKIDSLTK